MKTFFPIILASLLLPSLLASEVPVEERLIPLPVQLEIKDGTSFVLDANTRIGTLDDRLRPAVERLKGQITGTKGRPGTGLAFRNGLAEKNTIHVSYAREDLRPYGEEAYMLEIKSDRIDITVNSPKGVFYAGQTLIQLLPEGFYDVEKKNQWELPLVKITDYPRFSWRAFMLDEGRHFFGEGEVCRLLDEMAALKMNIFHWHLTNDGGWRIEIKKYPKLTEIGSHRKDTEIGTWGSGKTAGKPHGGFYTQEQIKRVVQYAADRNITIMPEISMPGHVSAMVAAYPELGTVKTPIEVPVEFGKLLPSLDASDEKVYQFLSDVLDEVVELFPGPVIHIGGDEVRFEHWNESESIKKLAQEKGFGNTNTDIQVYFTNRMSHIIEDKGKRMMGWNEILGHDLHGFNVETSTLDLARSTIIHFWKGSAEIAKTAAEKGHQVVNSTHGMTYLDYGYGTISLKKAYEFDPIFQGLDPAYHDKVLGLGCQMWTEWVSETDKLHYQIFPRLSAYAEVGWTPLDRKNFNFYNKRLDHYTKRWDALGLKYAKDVVVEITESDFFNAAKLAEWTPQDLERKKKEWPAGSVIKEKGTYKVSFFYKDGGHGVNIKSVSLTENGCEVARDTHPGFSGNQKKDITYTLQIEEDITSDNVILHVDWEGSGGMDSHGIIFIEKS